MYGITPKTIKKFLLQHSIPHNTHTVNIKQPRDVHGRFKIATKSTTKCTTKPITTVEQITVDDSKKLSGKPAANQLKSFAIFTNKMANEVDLTTYTNTIQSLGLTWIKKIDEINVFLNNEITKNSATKYLNLMSELVDRLNAMEITEKQRDILRNAFLSLFSTMASDECKTKMIKYLGESNKAISKKYNEVCKVYQKERGSYNEMAKKNNEKLKEEKVIIPSIQLSVTLKDDKKVK